MPVDSVTATRPPDLIRLEPFSPEASERLKKVLDHPALRGFELPEETHDEIRKTVDKLYSKRLPPTETAFKAPRSEGQYIDELAKSTPDVIKDIASIPERNLEFIATLAINPEILDEEPKRPRWTEAEIVHGLEMASANRATFLEKMMGNLSENMPADGSEEKEVADMVLAMVQKSLAECKTINAMALEFFSPTYPKISEPLPTSQTQPA